MPCATGGTCRAGVPSSALVILLYDAELILTYLRLGLGRLCYAYLDVYKAFPYPLAIALGIIARYRR
jgi:hypothetical protein